MRGKLLKWRTIEGKALELERNLGEKRPKWIVV